MIREIYTRAEGDPYYDPNIIDYSNEVESVVSQIRMLLGTTQGQVFGHYDFGVDLEQMVFGTRYTADRVMETVNEQINRYVKHSNGMYISCDINFGDSGKGYDYAILDVYINGVKSIGFVVDKNE